MSQVNKEILELRKKQLDGLKKMKHLEESLPHLYGFKHFWWTRKFYESTNRYTFLCASNQSGKDLDAETLIPTPVGFKKLKDIKVGHQVVSSTGEYCNVTAIPWDKENNTYKITFNDGSSVVCGPNHEWIAKHTSDQDFKVYSTAQIIAKSGLIQFEDNCFTLPTQGPTQRARVKHDHIHYDIMRLFGEKSTKDKRIYVQLILNRGLDERIEAVQAMMDYSGKVEDGKAIYCTHKEDQKELFLELLNSIGGIGVTTVKPNGYIVPGGAKVKRSHMEVEINYPGVLFRDRKDLNAQITKREVVRRIVRIEPAGRRRTICLTVDSPDHSFLCTRNYIVTHNSIVSIRKCVRWCTDQELWPKLWAKKPLYGMYFYPSFRLGTREVLNKWVKEVLPRNEYKDDPYYGWKLEYTDREVSQIKFNNGFNLYLMSYTQKASDLQASSPSFVFADEEMPQHLWGEVSARLLATKGHFHLVCTPTIGEDQWRRVFESDLMPNSNKIKVTMYDTVKFEDGTPGLRSVKEIEDYKATLPSQRDVDVRVYGKFAKLEGLVYPSFDPTINIVEPTPIDNSWIIYAGIDIGSGGNGHPAAISVVAVKPNHEYGKVIRFWVGNSHENTTSSDILRKFLDLTIDLKVHSAFYDFASADFGLIAQNAGVQMYKADKSHQLGQDLLNTLFKHKMLDIEAGELTPKLSEEFQNYKHQQKANKAKNDGIDSLRYAVSKIPWETKHLSIKTVAVKKETTENNKLTRGPQIIKVLSDDIDKEVEFWNEYYD